MSARPFYETSADLSKEQGVAEALAIRFQSECKKLPRAYPMDWAFLRNGKVSALAEIKCRGRKYPEMMLSLHKWLFGCSLQGSGVAFLLVYAFPHEIIYMNASKLTERPSVIFGGRTDRGDAQDMEPVVMLPVQWFVSIGL